MQHAKSNFICIATAAVILVSANSAKAENPVSIQVGDTGKAISPDLLQMKTTNSSAARQIQSPDGTPRNLPADMPKGSSLTARRLNFANSTD
jgi:hypothetical protein